MNHTDIVTPFWERLADITAGLLGTADDAARPVPMSHQLLDGDPTIWFITARDTDLAQAAENYSVAASYTVAEGGKGLYAIVQGELTRNNDPALLDALWSNIADTWFEGGKSDPDVRVLGFAPETAEVWLTPTSGLHFAFNIVRAKMTGSQPDMGAHGTLSRADFEGRRAAT